MGVFLKIEGEFLTVITGIGPRYLITAMTVILVLELLYTVIGGMISVVITDFFQYILLSSAMIVVTTYAVLHAHWDHLVHKVAITMGPGGFDPLSATHFGYTFVVWQLLLWLSVCTCWQTTAMRMLSTRSPDVSRRVMMWTGAIFLGRGMLPMIWGIAALTLFGSGALREGVPAPMIGGRLLAPIDAMPAMLASILRPGIKGLVVAGMLAATMSVNSSYMLGWSAVISQDIVIPLRRMTGAGELSSRSQLVLNRSANLFVSLFLMFWGLYYTPPGTIYLYLNVTGTIFLAGAFVSVVAGLYWRRANATGGLFALLCGAGGVIIPFFFLHWNESRSGLVSFGLAAVGMLVGSLANPGSAGKQRNRPEATGIW